MLICPQMAGKMLLFFEEHSSRQVTAERGSALCEPQAALPLSPAQPPEGAGHLEALELLHPLL